MLFFKPSTATNTHEKLTFPNPSRYSLAISSGEQGHRLTHNHTRHFNYVLQSLSLWSEIVDDMFRLWYLAGEDILGDAP